MNLTEKVAYLKGLAQGLELESDTKTGKLIACLIDTLGEAAKEITALQEEAKTLGEYIEEIDCDLGDVEELIFEDDEEDDSDDMLELSCPHCNETIYVDDGVDLNSLKCPECGHEFTVRQIDGECGCDCGCTRSEE